MPSIDRPQSFVLRAATGVDERSLLEPARRTIAGVAPGVAVQQTTTMGRVRDRAIGPARQVVVLLLLMSAVALTLGAVGVYGVIAHFASRRRRDWAIRIALGLPRSQVIAARGDDRSADRAARAVGRNRRSVHDYLYRVPRLTTMSTRCSSAM